MKLHANAALSLTQRRRMVLRVVEQGWTVKDHLTHMAAWERSTAFLLRRQPRHEGLGVPEEVYLHAGVHKINAAIREQTADRSLDEAFAGVDDDSRAKCLGLLATFDMDVAMTSEWEWGCYPQVPGLGICQFARHDGIDAVLVTPWRWDGRERRPAERAAL